MFTSALCKFVVCIILYFITCNILVAHALFLSSTPQDSELMQLNTIALNAFSYDVQQLVLLSGEVVAGLSITTVDIRTSRVHLALDEEFFLKVPLGESIELSGVATVRDVLGADATSLQVPFLLELKLVEEVSLKCSRWKHYTNAQYLITDVSSARRHLFQA
jgi:hypothetical protein